MRFSRSISSASGVSFKLKGHGKSPVAPLIPQTCSHIDKRVKGDVPHLLHAQLSYTPSPVLQYCRPLPSSILSYSRKGLPEVRPGSSGSGRVCSSACGVSPPCAQSCASSACRSTLVQVCLRCLSSGLSSSPLWMSGASADVGRRPSPRLATPAIDDQQDAREAQLLARAPG